MKKNVLYIILSASIIAIAGCAKVTVSGPNDSSKLFLEAWMHIYNQNNGTDIKPSGLGIYVLEETPGTGDKTVSDNGYVIVDYTITDLDGNISSYTEKTIAKQLGQYDTTVYYGPDVWLTMNSTIPAGVQNALVGMKTGGKKKVLIPSWLMSYSTYETEAEYLNQSTDYSNTIYNITVRDYTDSIDVWQIDSIKRYIVKNYGSLDAFTNDTTGFYYRQTQAPIDDKDFPSDTTIYINYTGKLLNGLVFDTTIERVAKDNGCYDPSKTYKPVAIKWADTHNDITMGNSSTSVIDGFSMTLWQMKAMEHGIGIFYSNLGYSYSGSEPSIPSYAPLIFEIQITDEPKD